jgi:hypothetical protein
MLRSDVSHLSFSRLPVRTCLFLTRRGGESTAKKHPEQVILTITNTPKLPLVPFSARPINEIFVAHQRGGMAKALVTQVRQLER